MLKDRVELLWDRNYRQYFYLLLFLSFIVQIQCQIIRKSVELPVRDYLSAPKRNSRDGKDHLYVQGSNIDSVRNFEVLSPHTPASALMFASLTKSSSDANPTLLPLSSPVDGPGRSGENRFPKLFNPAVSSSNHLRLNNRRDKLLDRLFSRNKSPSTDLLEDGLNKATKGYSFSFSDPPLDRDTEPGSQGVSQEFIPVFSTPFPLLYENNYDTSGYLSTFSSILPVAHEGVEGRNTDSVSGFSQYVTPTPLQYLVPRFEDRFLQQKIVPPQPFSTPSYKQKGGSGDYYDYSSRENNHQNPSSSKEIIKNNNGETGSNDYYEKSQEKSDYDNSNDDPNLQNHYTKQAPYVPPTIGVIGWKSNTDHETTWKPTKALMNMANQHINEDMKNKGYEQVSTTPISPPKEVKVEGNNKDETKVDEEEEEEEEEEDGKGEEEEEEESEEEGGEEEEEEEEGGESEEEENNVKEPPPRPPPRYENSAENYKWKPIHSPPRYENLAETPRDPPSYEGENNGEEPPSRPPPRYESSAENYRGQPIHPPPSYENSAETPRDPPSYQGEDNGKEPPPRPTPSYVNSAENYREPPSYPPPQYENSAEYYQEPSRRPPQEYDGSPENSREALPPPITKYGNSVENYNPSPSPPPPRYENSAENYERAPLQSPPSYENSAEYRNANEYNKQYHNNNGFYSSELPHRSREYSYDGQTLPPGPPYNPPSFAHDPRSRFGYLSPPSYFQPVSLPIETGVSQSWTPIIPAAKSITSQENKNVPEYKSNNGRWLLNGGSILKNDFGEYNSGFQNWDEFGKERSLNQVDETKTKQEGSNQKRTKPRIEETSYRVKPNDNGEHILKREKQEKRKVKGDKLPVEHREKKESNKESSKERNSSEESAEEASDSDYQPPPPPRDLDEERVRNHVSDREKPRKVPTRLRYPGGGLWAKPNPDSGVDLGFVPKKVYTQTRKHNVVRHLPREAALQAASTAEEIINAPRLREVVSHKKVQEVYEEEGYEDSGYDHGGYKKHGASKSDSNKFNSGEQHAPAEAEGPEATGPEEVFEEHLRHLEEIPEDTKGDPTGEGSVKQLVQVSEKPKVKGSWKQQKTTTNERSLAFLDEEGKGGILTEKHPTKVEGVEGKYLDVDGKRVPIVREITDSPLQFINHGDAISFQRHSPANVRTNEEKAVVYNKFADDPKDEVLGYTSPLEYTSQSYIASREQGDPSSQESDEVKNSFTKPYSQPSIDLEPTRFHYESSTGFPQLSGYNSRNNRFSFIQPQKKKSTDNIINYYPGQDSVENKDYDSTKSAQPTQAIFYDSETLRPKSEFGSVESSLEPAKIPNLHAKYSSRFASTTNGNPALLRSQSSFHTERSYDVTQELGAQSKERKSRDLTAVGIDGVGGEVFNGEFTHPTAALRVIEDNMSQISRETFDRPPRSRSRSSEVGTARKYNEIVRTPNQNQEESIDDKKDKIDVKLTDEDVNIRHPFLPRDGSGDIKIDYVKIRNEYDSTTSPPVRKYFEEDVEFASVTEEPTTTTTPKVTTIKSKTTTEYVPEDPSQTLIRLKSNPFLSSIFQGQENQGEKTKFYEENQTTTTPKITTYRAKPTTEDVSGQEADQDTLHRLKNNPFLSSVISVKEENNQNERNKQTQIKRGNRLKPIVVLPEEPDTKSDSSVKHVEKLTLAHYSGPNHGLMYQQVPMRTRQRISNLARHLNSEGMDPMHIVVRRSADPVQQTDKINVAASGTTTEIPVDTEKYPFYYSPASVSFPKYSPLRYATSPKDIPKKTNGGMEFYESRDKAVRCEEPTPPKNIVPEREKEGEWNKSPQPEKQRLGKLGDQIDCLKAKYFGEDPLDNPFFKETEIGVPDFTSQSPGDSFGFHSDIKQNIKSNPESNGDFFKSSNSKWEIGIHQNSFGKKGDEKGTSATKKHTISKPSLRTRSNSIRSPFSEKPTYLEADYQESRITNQFISPGKKNTLTNKDNYYASNLKINNNENNQTDSTVSINKTTNPPLSEIQLRSSGPIRLHPPKNVIISFRSKGTANHPRIKVIKGKASLYNVNVKVVPMSSVGYLKSHTPVHIRVEDLTSDKSQYLLDPLYELDPISSAASQIAKQKKIPTTVTYLTMNPEGKLIHQHIRTFIPVSKKTFKEKENAHEVLDSAKVATMLDLPLRDERRSESKLRVKRNHENDKYINSKESLELKNFLLQKYAEILAKEKEEASRQNTEREKIRNEKLSTQPAVPISTSRNTEGFAHGIRPQYSSRYRARGADPMHQSPSTEVKVSNLGNNTQNSNHKFPLRKPKVRFPKLTMTTRTVSESNRTKLLNLPESIPVRLITTTTTTTTEPPPSTTTRMYKPKVVYKKEYGKPIEKVVDMFAVLKRHPSLSSEQTTTTTTTTEHLPVFSEEPFNSGSRKYKPKRLQQFEHRTITKEEVIRRTYTPESENSRSDKARTYDSIYDHPDLRGPISRISRDTEQDDYQEMLVYMVNPTTGVGEWTVMPIPAKAVSRIGERFDSLPEKRNDNNFRRSEINSRSRSNRENSDLWVHTGEPRSEENTTETDQEMSTSTPKKVKSKTRRKPNNRRHKDKVYQSSSQLRNNRQRSSEDATTPEDAVPTPTTTPVTATPTDATPEPSTLNPRIIMEPHKRKYFYAKI